MIFKVPKEKMIYSREPDNALAYTKGLDKAYSKYAGLYDVSVRYLPFWKTWIKAAIPLIEGNRVLETSFGTGYLLMQYAENFETHGIDFNNEMIEIAAKNLAMKGINASLQWANIEELPFDDNYFDTVINTMAFSGYPDGRRAMAEMHRVLRVGGKLIVIDFDFPTDRNLFGYALTKLMESGGDTIRDLSKVIQDFPFEATEEEIGGFGSVHLHQARKLTNS